MEAIDPAEVRAALEQVLAGPSFVNAGRLSRMLRFVVERTLDGQGDQLKEYLLGVEVFDRPPEYDPRLDSIVRVEARRLRGKLAEYYEAEGAGDALRIRLTKGGYAPTFERRGSETLAAASSSSKALDGRAGRLATRSVAGIAGLALVLSIALWGWPARWRVGSPAPALTVAVLPFHVFSGRESDQRLADRLADGVTTELARTHSMSVAAHTDARRYRDPQLSLREIGQALGATVLMEGTVHVDAGAVRLEVRLVDVAAGRKLWVDDFVSVSGDLDRLELDASAAAANYLRTRYRR